MQVEHTRPGFDDGPITLRIRPSVPTPWLAWLRVYSVYLCALSCACLLVCGHTVLLLWAILDITAVNTSVQIPVGACVFSIRGSVPRDGIIGIVDNFI